MSESFAGREIPEKLREVLDAVPESIRDLLKKAFEEGAGIKIVEVDEAAEEKKRRKKPLMKDVIKSLLNPPSTGEMVKMAVSRLLAENDIRCSMCIAETQERAENSARPVIARCLAGRSVTAALLHVGIKLANDLDEKSQIDLITKTIDMIAKFAKKRKD